MEDVVGFLRGGKNITQLIQAEDLRVGVILDEGMPIPRILDLAHEIKVIFPRFSGHNEELVRA